MLCDKSRGMNIVRVLSVAIPLVALYACSGGGGSSSSSSFPPWEKFRHDISNSGQGVGDVGTGVRTVKWALQIDPLPTPPVSGETPKPISSSPAIAQDGTIYIGTEGGTLAAVNPNGTLKWRATTCGSPQSTPVAGSENCTIEGQPLGSLVSSAAEYTLNGKTTVLIGSMNGTFFILQDNGSTSSCTNCFRPNLAEFGPGATAQFVSSPTFTTNSATSTIAGIFVGATIVDDQGRQWGKLYAINNDGSRRWEFPRSGSPPIGPVTSSPAVGLGGTLYFTAADTAGEGSSMSDNLYAVTSTGALKWKSPIGKVLDPAAASALASSPVVNMQIFVATADGNVFSINPANGSPRWRVRPMLAQDDGGVFISSLAIGIPVSPTPELTPTFTVGSATPLRTATATPTPTPETSVTATPTPPSLTVFGVTKSGVLVAIDASTGNTIAPTGPLATPIPSPVISSPALSLDSLLVFGANDGKVHIVDTTTGMDSPVALKGGVPVGIRSSPAIASNGTIYIGADDGMLYAIEMQ